MLVSAEFWHIPAWQVIVSPWTKTC